MIVSAGIFSAEFALVSDDSNDDVDRKLSNVDAH
jgi:hypothetical protein